MSDHIPEPREAFPAKRSEIPCSGVQGIAAELYHLRAFHAGGAPPIGYIGANFPVLSLQNREMVHPAGRDGFARDCAHNHAVGMSQTISGSATLAGESPAFPARHARASGE